MVVNPDDKVRKHELDYSTRAPREKETNGMSSSLPIEHRDEHKLHPVGKMADMVLRKEAS